MSTKHYRTADMTEGWEIGRFDPKRAANGNYQLDIRVKGFWTSPIEAGWRRDGAHQLDKLPDPDAKWEPWIRVSGGGTEDIIPAFEAYGNMAKAMADVLYILEYPDFWAHDMEKAYTKARQMEADHAAEKKRQREEKMKDDPPFDREQAETWIKLIWETLRANNNIEGHEPWYALIEAVPSDGSNMSRTVYSLIQPASFHPLRLQVRSYIDFRTWNWKFNEDAPIVRGRNKRNYLPGVQSNRMELMQLLEGTMSLSKTRVHYANSDEAFRLREEGRQIIVDPPVGYKEVS